MPDPSPTDPVPLLRDAEALMRAGRFREAADLCRRILDPAGPASGAEPVHSRAEIVALILTAHLLEAGAAAAAADLAGTLVRRDAERPEFLHAAGVAALRLGDADGAVALLGRAVALNDWVARHHTDLAAALKRAGRLVEAAESQRRALDLDPAVQQECRAANERILRAWTLGPHLARPRTLLFCTAHLTDRAAWEERCRPWLEHHRASPLAADRICIVDDGGTFRPDPDPGVLHRFADHLGRRSAFVFPGWWRSFTAALDLAGSLGCTKIVHVESDAFVLSRRLALYINALDAGWTAFWSPLADRPESAIQVVCADQFERFAAFARHAADDPVFARGAEHALPFTATVRCFRGDRYGDYTDRIPPGADYACQVNRTLLPAVARRA